ncbi:MAG: hypothetical protein K5981_02130 [Clostridia bacterium]|nr:hypothetical protein [Clostridia bacterium]
MPKKTSEKKGAESLFRACAGYDPRTKVIEVTDNTDPSRPRKALYLQVKHREEWFHHYCDEHGLNGNYGVEDMIRSADGTIIALKAVAKMTGDGVCAEASGLADVIWGQANPMAQAETKAIGRALAHLGFGTTMLGLDEEAGIKAFGDLADSGVTVEEPAVHGEQEMIAFPDEFAEPPAPAPKKRAPRKKAEAEQITMMPAEEPEEVPAPAVAPAPVTAPAPAPAPAAPAANAVPKSMTLEEARNLVLNKPGNKYDQATMGAIYLKDRRMIEFYATKYAKNDVYKLAAQIILSQSEM